MFVRNQCGNQIEEINRIKISTYWSQATKDGAKKIEDDCKDFYRIGRYVVDCSEEIKEALEKYYDGKEKEFEIYINDIKFEKYKESKGNEIYEEMIIALKNGEQFFDMGEV